MNKYPNVEFDTKSLEKYHNKDIKLKISDKYSVKFHVQNLEHYVRIEQGK